MEIKEIRLKEVSAQKDLFELEEVGLLLSEENKRKFHSTTARLLYLTNHMRPALKVACQFLCTHAQCLKEFNEKKLQNLLMYLWSTQRKKMIFNGDNNNHLKFYVNVAFVFHPDGKSHTGLVVEYGGSVIFCKSKKQEICTKDSTEAEIVSVLDKIPEMGWIKILTWARCKNKLHHALSR